MLCVHDPQSITNTEEIFTGGYYCDSSEFVVPLLRLTGWFS